MHVRINTIYSYGYKRLPYRRFLCILCIFFEEKPAGKPDKLLLTNAKKKCCFETRIDRGDISICLSKKQIELEVEGGRFRVRSGGDRIVSLLTLMIEIIAILLGAETG